MPRTRNVTREQWTAAVSPVGDPGASAIRSLGSALAQRQPKSGRSSFEQASDDGADPSSKENVGYDWVYSGDHDENPDDENIPPTLVDKGKGKAKAKEDPPKGKKRKPQPLQDITDLVVSHRNRPSDTEETPRGGRRVKRRRQDRTIPTARPTSPSPAINRAAATRKPFPSSLPPSSPPPPASFELPTSSAQHRNEIWDVIVPDEQEELPLASDDPEPARNSDPFGFFTVEKELKAQRNRDSRPGPSTSVREALGSVLVPISSPPPLHLDVTAILDGSGEEEYISPCATPQTPHKKKRTQGGLSKGKQRESLVFSPRTESAPSSPSPLKVREPRKKSKTVEALSDFGIATTGRFDGIHEGTSDNADGGDGDKNFERTPTPPRRVLRSQARPKQLINPLPPSQRRPGAKRWKEPESKTPSDPVELAQKLVNKLPKGRKKRMAEKEEAEEAALRRPKRQRKTHPPKVVKREKISKPKVEVDKGRQAIREYFKKVDEYTLEEEKVYVI